MNNYRCRSSSRGDNLNGIGLGGNPQAMEVNGSHRSLHSLQQQQQQQQQSPQHHQGGRMANGTGREHWTKLPEPQNGHDPQVSRSTTGLTTLNCRMPKTTREYLA